MRSHCTGAETGKLPLLLAWQVIVVTALLLHRLGHRHAGHINQQCTDEHTPERNTHQATSLFASGKGASVGV